MPPKKIPKPDKNQPKLSFVQRSAPPPDRQAKTAEVAPTSIASQSVDLPVSDHEPDGNHANGSAPTPAGATGPGIDKKRKHQDRWLKIWPWLFFEKGKMFCKECLKHGKNNAFTSGCETFKTSSMSRHEETDDHKSSGESAKLKSDMNVAVKKTHEAQDLAIVKALKVVYWLASENLPLSKYESQMNLMKELEVPGLCHLGVSGRVTYESYYTANELLEAISATIDEQVNADISDSPFVSILCDESTDISNTPRMTINARIINPRSGKAKSLFLQDLEYEDGSGEGLCNEILHLLKQRGIPMKKIVGLGTDGASVMTSDVPIIADNRLSLDYCLKFRLSIQDFKNRSSKTNYVRNAKC